MNGVNVSLPVFVPEEGTLSICCDFRQNDIKSAFFFPFLMIQVFFKSIHICQSYERKSTVMVCFDSRCIYMYIHVYDESALPQGRSQWCFQPCLTLDINCAQGSEMGRSGFPLPSPAGNWTL